MLVVGIRPIGSNAVMKTQVKISLTILGTIFSLLSSTSYAGQVTIPNTFVSETSARAGEVNANFNSVKAAVDDNNQRITGNAANITNNTADIGQNAADIGQLSNNVKLLVAVDANGIDIGFASIPNRLGTVNIATSMGYYSSMYPGKGRLAIYDTLYFTDTTCGGSGGTTWIDYSFAFALIPGTVFENNNYEMAGSSDTWPTNDLWYLPQSATFLNNQIVGSSKSSYPGSSCSSVTQTLLEAAQVFPNDPAITGIANTPYPAPISLEYR